MHLAGSPGSYFAYLKDCLKEWSRKLECKLSMAEAKILRLKINITESIMNHAFKIKNRAATTITKKKSVGTLIQERGFQFGSKFFKT